VAQLSLITLIALCQRNDSETITEPTVWPHLLGTDPGSGARGGTMNAQDNRPPEDEDVEGHRKMKNADAETSGDEEVEGHRKMKNADAETSDEEDVEGHRRSSL